MLVKTGRKKRCIKLRVAPPRPKDADRGQLALDFIGTITSTAHYELTFKRVNEDGSPYAG